MQTVIKQNFAHKDITFVANRQFLKKVFLTNQIKTFTKVSSVFRPFKPKPYGFERKSPHLRCAPGCIFFQRLEQTDYYTNKVNVLSQFRKKCVFKS